MTQLNRKLKLLRKTKVHQGECVADKSAFTLVELLVVIGIIILILAIALPPTVRMLADSKNASAFTHVQGMLKLAKSRAKEEMGVYGICFYVDQLTSKQHAVFVRWGGPPPEQFRAGPDAAAYWNRYAERMTVAQDKPYTFPGPMRVRTLHPPYRNVFMTIFDPNKGKDVPPTDHHRYILYDPDTDDDSLGDTLDMPVIDIDNEWHLYRQVGDPSSKVRSYELPEPIEDIVDLPENVTSGMPYTEFDNSWGFVLYNHADWSDWSDLSDELEAEDYINREGEFVFLDKAGSIIQTRAN